MPGFYALILACDDASTQPGLRMVQTASSVDALRAVADYDPVGPFSTVARDQFVRTWTEEHDINNRFSGVVDGAAIYAMKHV